MITKNLRNLIKLSKTHGYYNNIGYTFPTNILKSTTGVFQTGSYYIEDLFTGNPYIATAIQTDRTRNVGKGLVVRFGTGTTASTELDYMMESEITDYSVINTIQNNSARTNEFNDDNTVINNTISLNFDLKNIGTEDLIINEIGITYGLRTSINGYKEPWCDHILICREVLSEPIVIPANGLFSLTKTINIDRNTDYEYWE